MLSFKRHFRLAAWIATLAILLGALAPAVSQAMTVLGDGNTRWVEVCTSTGMHWVAVDPDDVGQDDGTPAASTASCAYCCTHAGSTGLPPPLGLSFAVKPASMLEPLLFFTAPKTLFAWTVSSPRAPPFTS